MTRLLKQLPMAVLFILIGYCAHAQRGGFMPFRNAPTPNNRQDLNNRFNGGKRIGAIKNAYLNRQLNLSPEEADAFWPVYNQYQDELTQVLHQRRQNNSNPQGGGMEQVNKDIYYEQRILAIRKHYKDQFLRILPPEKVSTLYKSEREFKDELIKQLMERGNPDDQ